MLYRITTVSITQLFTEIDDHVTLKAKAIEGRMKCRSPTKSDMVNIVTSRPLVKKNRLGNHCKFRNFTHLKIDDTFQNWVALFQYACH